MNDFKLTQRAFHYYFLRDLSSLWEAQYEAELEADGSALACVLCLLDALDAEKECHIKDAEFHFNHAQKIQNEMRPTDVESLSSPRYWWKPATVRELNK